MGGASKIPLPPPLVTQTCSCNKRKGDTNHKSRWSEDSFFSFSRIPTNQLQHVKHREGIGGCKVEKVSLATLRQPQEVLI